MRIGILGSGNVGSAFGKVWAEAGHEIMFGVRDVQSPSVNALLASMGSAGHQAGTVIQAVAFGDVVLLAVPWSAVQEVVQQAGDWRGKVLIDATNRFAPAALGDLTSGAEQVAQWAPSAIVVKCFNTLGTRHLGNLRFGSQNADTFICGDDENAKSVVSDLAKAIGFDVVDAGPISNAELVESMGRLWVQLALRLGVLGPDIAFKVIKR